MEFVQPSERGERWFASAWPGRWRFIDADWSRPDRPDEDRQLRHEIDAELARAELPEGLDRTTVSPRYVCEDCHALIIGAATDEHERREWIGDWDGTSWIWRPIPPFDRAEPRDPGPRLGGDHRHDDLSGPIDGRIRYYEQHPTGPYKVEVLGTLGDIVEAMPYLVWFGNPFPPLAVINEVLSTGEDNAGMSGGVEFPPLVMSGDDYDQLRRSPRWDKTGYVDVDVPDDVRTQDGLRGWWQSVLDGYPRYAVEQFWEEFHSQFPTGVTFSEAEQARRWARRVELCRGMLDEIERIIARTAGVLEVRLAVIYPGGHAPMGSVRPPDGPAGDAWRDIVDAMTAAVTSPADGSVLASSREGVLVADLVAWTDAAARALPQVGRVLQRRYPEAEITLDDEPIAVDEDP